MPKRKISEVTCSRLDTWARGMIWAFFLTGMPQEQIRLKVPKRDGSLAQLNAIEKVIKKKEHPEWRGADNRAGGAPGQLDG